MQPALKGEFRKIFQERLERMQRLQKRTDLEEAQVKLINRTVYYTNEDIKELDKDE